MTGFDKLVHEHHSLVYRIALGILRRPDMAEDAAQEVFLDLWRRPGALEAADDLRAFLARCAVNRALRALRDNSRRTRYEKAATRGEEAMRGEDTVFRAEIRRKVGELPEEERLAVDLHYFQGLTLAQAATALEVTDRTISNRLRAGLEKLKRALGAAAFVALLAGLESEMRNVTAEPVPDGARERLARRLSQEGGTGTGAGRSGGGSDDPGTPGRGRRAVRTALALCAAIALVVLGSFVASKTRKEESRGPEASSVAKLESAPAGGPAELRDPVGALEDAPDRERDLHGIVVDGGGNPVAGASVQVCRRRMTWGGHGAPESWGTGTPGVSTRTRQDGQFRIRLKPRETVDLEVAAVSLSTVTVPCCRAGERLRIVLPRGVLVVVQAVTAAGAPLPGARIRLVRRVANEDSASEMLTQSSACVPTHDYDRLLDTGADGKAAFEGVPAGETFAVDGVHPDCDFQSTKAVAGPGPECRVTLTFPEGRTIRGRVIDIATLAPIPGARICRFNYLSEAVPAGADGLFELKGWLQGSAPDAFATGYTLANKKEVAEDTWEILMRKTGIASGRVIDEKGRPVEGAMVCQGTEGHVVMEPYVLTDEAGMFRVTLRTDREDWGRITAAAPGRGRAVVQLEESNEDVDVGDVVLAAARRLEGRLLESDGSPVSRVRILLTATADIAEFLDSYDPPGPFDVCLTDDLGRFSFETGDTGPVHLVACPPGRVRFEREVAMPATGDVADVEVRLLAGKTVAILAVDDLGTPLPDVSVRLRATSGVSSAITGSDGRARILLLDAEGTIEADGPAGHFDPEDVAVKDAGDVRLVCRRGGVVRGTIVDQQGRSTRFDRVRIEAGGRTLWAGWVRFEGKFEAVVPADGSPADLVIWGRWRVDSPDYELSDLEWPTRIPNVASGMEDLKLVAKDPVLDRRIRAHVVAPDGSPVAGVYVRASLPGGRPFASAKSDESGVAEVGDLPAETLDFRAEPGYESEWEAGDPVRALPDGGDIECVVRRR